MAWYPIFLHYRIWLINPSFSYVGTLPWISVQDKIRISDFTSHHYGRFKWKTLLILRYIIISESLHLSIKEDLDYQIWIKNRIWETESSVINLIGNILANYFGQAKEIFIHNTFQTLVTGVSSNNSISS